MRNHRPWLRAGLRRDYTPGHREFVGVGYPHLCAAGSPWIERRRHAIGYSAGRRGGGVLLPALNRVGLVVALCLLTVDFVARDP
jgi:hypothetical protein